MGSLDTAVAVRARGVPSSSEAELPGEVLDFLGWLEKEAPSNGEATTRPAKRLLARFDTEVA